VVLIGEGWQKATAVSANPSVTIVSHISNSRQFYLIGVHLPINHKLFLLPLVKTLNITVVLEVGAGILLRPGHVLTGGGGASVHILRVLGGCASNRTADKAGPCARQAILVAV
jgi:hypothetical protein